MSFIHSKKMYVINLKKHALRAVSSLAVAAVMITSSAPAIASADAISETGGFSCSVSAAAPAKVKLESESRYNTGKTHPFNYQTSRLTVRWKAAKGAKKYQVYIKGGKYENFTKIAETSKLSYTAKKLTRIKTYKFKVRAVSGSTKGAFSDVQTLRTSRIDYDKSGWKAMCRIVFHEVGNINDPMWDAPIVHVADCVVNRYEAAKYLDDPTWAPYYAYYDNVQSMIYNSGDFMSDAGLAYDGATYARCTSTVKKAVYGALYSKVMVSGVKPSKKVFFWSNTSYRPSSRKIAYSYKIPWGYFNVWKEYWG